MDEREVTRCSSVTNRWSAPVLALTAQLAANEQTALLSFHQPWLRVCRPPLRDGTTPDKSKHGGILKKRRLSLPDYREKAESTFYQITSVWTLNTIFGPRIGRFFCLGQTSVFLECQNQQQQKYSFPSWDK